MATRSVPQPPFSMDVLAELHAGNLDPEVRDQLWPAVQRDPDALRVLRSLDEVSAALRDLGSRERVIHPMPADIAARLEQFVTDLDGVEPTERIAGPSASVEVTTPLTTGMGWAPPRGNGTGDHRPAESGAAPRPIAAPPDASVLPLRRPARRYLLAAAAAAAVALAGVAALAATLRPAETGTPVAQSPALDVGDQLTSTAALSVLGRNDVTGPLGSETALRDCVAANGLDRAVLGSTDIVFRGRESVLILLAGPRAPAVTALVVGTGCTTGDPQQLTVTDIG